MGGWSEAMAQPSVVIQTLGRFTAYHAGRAAAQRGYLRAFVNWTAPRGTNVACRPLYGATIVLLRGRR